MTISLNKPQKVSFAEVWTLAFPQMLSSLSVMVLGLTDLWVAGRIMPEVQASIGLVTQVQAFLMVMAMALGSGAMAAVSQSLGATKKQRASYFVCLILALSLLIACIISVIFLLLGSTATNLLEIDPNMRPIMIYFWNVFILSLPFQYLMQISNTLLRASKDVNIPLAIVVLVCVLNIFGDLAFGLGMFGMPNFSFAGIAWSTFGSVFVGSLLFLALLVYRKLLSFKNIPNWRWVKQALPYIFRVAIPSMVGQFFWQTAYLILFVFVAALPMSVYGLAGMSAGMRVESMLFMPAFAFHATASILVGHALGRRDIKEAKRVGIFTAVMGTVGMCLVALIMWPLRSSLAMFFSPDPAVQEIIISYLTYNILSTPFTVSGMILGGAIIGAGATIYHLFVILTSAWLIRLPLSYLLSFVFGYGIEGIFITMLLSQVYQAGLTIWIFFKCDWTKYALLKIKK